MRLQVYFLSETFVALLAVKRLLALVREGVWLPVAAGDAVAATPRHACRSLFDLGRLLFDQHVLGSYVFVSLSAMDFADVLNHCSF